VRSVEPEHNPEIAALLREGREAVAQRPSPRQLRAELLVGGAFLVAAVALLLLAPEGMAWRAGPIAALLPAYALANNVRFELAQGGTDASLLVLVPMLFIAPVEAVPLLVMVGYALGRIPDIARGREHPLDLVFVPASAWHAVGPAAVLAFATDPGGPRWEDWPWFVAALGAMLLCDTASGLAREALGRGVRPDLQLRLLARVWMLDAALAPVGLLAAFAATRGTYGFLLVAPLALILATLARERGTRLGHALDLAQARTALLESELAASRGREEALAAVSHGLQTPLASVIGLARLLDERGDALTAERRGVAVAQLHTEALALRHRVRQVLDYPRLRSGRPLALRPARCDLAAVIGRAIAASGVQDVTMQLAPDLPTLDTDGIRVEQVLTALLDNATRHGAAPVSATVEAVDGTIRIAVSDRGGGVPQELRPTLFDDPAPERGRDESAGTGIGLFVADGIAKALGGRLWVEDAAEGGSRFVLDLPATSEPPREEA
jgi:signal transduction histidine kinase